MDGFLGRRVGGIPVWVLLLAGGVGAGWWWDRRRKAAAAAQQAQAAQSAAPQSGSGGQGDPFLTAYQAGEASGVAEYAAGVSAGTSLVDSIMGLFPGGQTIAAGGGAPGGIGGGSGGGGAGNPGTPGAKTPSSTGSAAAGSPAGSIAGYSQILNPAAGSAYYEAGLPIYDLPTGQQASSSNLIEVASGGKTFSQYSGGLPSGTLYIKSA